eukprot:4860897-Prymnesium_polylepis.1
MSSSGDGEGEASGEGDGEASSADKRRLTVESACHLSSDMRGVSSSSSCEVSSPFDGSSFLCVALLCGWPTRMAGATEGGWAASSAENNLEGDWSASAAVKIMSS